MWRFKIIIFLIPLIFVFGQDKDRILFQHSLHVDDMELSCEECHAGVSEADGPSWNIFPKMDLCLECHDGDTADGACEYCHSTPDDPLTFSESWKVNGLGFSHAIHLTESDDCNKCHSYIDDDNAIGLPNNVWNESDCLSCHMDLDAGPSTHNLAWKELHGSEINSSTINNCSLCHANNSCEECHQLQQFTPETHPVDYMFTHGFEAKAGVMECSTCHEIIEDCYACHVENQVMPMNHNFHNWVSTSGGLHGEFAASEAELCATCHLPAKDSSCLKCHTGD